MNAPSHASRARQGGAVLVTVLVLLLVMTLLGLASIRTSIIEERGAASLYDRSLGFQAAEAGLRAGEAFAASLAAASVPAAGVCTAGVCGFPNTNADAIWKSSTVWATAKEAVIETGGRVERVKYIVELLADSVPSRGTCTTTGDVSGSPCSGSERRYRITARSLEADRATVILQSIYAVP